MGTVTSTSSLLWNVFRAGLQSGSIMCAADAFTQIAIEQPSSSSSAIKNADDDDDDDDKKSLDLKRCARWGLAGLCIHGPYFFLGFRRVDGYFGATTSFLTVLQKTAAAQFILFPPYLVALFGYMGYMESHNATMSEIGEKIRHRVPEAFVSGCVYWPVANGINFALVPSTLRVPYLAFSAGVWNSYLSWANAKDGRR